MAEMSMVKRVGRAIAEANQEEYMEFAALHDAMARAAIEAIELEQLLMAAYVRGVEWNEENPLDREYRFKAAGDYADKTIFAALSEEVAE